MQTKTIMFSVVGVRALGSLLMGMVDVLSVEVGAFNVLWGPHGNVRWVNADAWDG